MKHSASPQKYRHPEDDNNSSASGEFIAAGQPAPTRSDNLPPISHHTNFPDLQRRRKRSHYSGIHRTSAPLIILWDELDTLSHPTEFDPDNDDEPRCN